MSDIAISVEGISKAYRIGLKEEVPDSLVATVGSWVKSPLRNFKNLRSLDTFSAADGESELSLIHI